MSAKGVTILVLENMATAENDSILTFDGTLDCRLDMEKTAVGCVAPRGERGALCVSILPCSRAIGN